MSRFDEMSGPQLAEEYNAMARKVSGVRVVNRFENREVGISRCEFLERQIAALEASDIPDCLKRYDFDAHQGHTTITDTGFTVSDPSEDSVAVEADRRWRNWQPSPGRMTRPRKDTFAREIREERARAVEAAASAPVNSLASASRSKRLNKVIRILVNANPRRAGSEAHRHFEAMRGGITVGEYLSRFPEKDRKVASQWLSNTVREGFVNLLG